MRDLGWTCRGLERLEKSLQACKTEQQRRPLLVRKACFFARLSRTDEARSMLHGLMSQRQAFEPLMSAWVLFCEGLIEHFDSLSNEALGKFRRAQAVSIAAGDRELAAISSAWIANAEFCAGNVSGVVHPLRQAFDYAEPSNSGALGRAALVVADLLHWGGQPTEARAWYKEARDHAVEEGDISMQSIVFFNEIAFKVAGLVMRNCERASIPEQDIRIAQMTLDSVGNLDMGLGMERLTSMIPLLKAELFTVAGRWDEAAGLFDVFLADSSVQPHARLVPKFLAERALCKVKLGDTAGAIRDVDRSIVASVACTDMDDLYVLHSRVATVYEAIGRASFSEAHMQSAERCLSAFKELQDQLQLTVRPLIEAINMQRAMQRKSPA